MRRLSFPRRSAGHPVLALGLAAGAVLALNAPAQEIIIFPPPNSESATMQADDIRRPSDGPQRVVVTYTSSVAIDRESIDHEDIWVTSRNGYNELGRLLSVEEAPSPIADPAGGLVAPFRIFSLRATYLFESEDGWGEADNGEYAVLLQRDQVDKADGTSFPPQLLGFFQVRIGVEPPPIPEFATLRVFQEPGIVLPGQEPDEPWRAELQVAYGRPGVEVTDWGKLRREGNRFSVDIVAQVRDGEPAGENAVQTRTYPIGDLVPGSYSMVVTSFGQTIARDEWVVRDSPDPRPAFPVDVQIEVREQFSPILIFPPPPPSYVADVRLEFAEQGFVQIVDWGEVRREGNTFHAEVLAVVRPWPIGPDGQIIVPPGVPPVFEQRYVLGSNLEPGEYGFRLTSRGRDLGADEFVVRDDNPDDPPADVRLDVATGGDTATIRAAVQFLEPGWVLFDIGTAELVDDRTFVIDASARRFIRPPERLPIYHLGGLAAGEYDVVFQINGQTRAETRFVIEGGGGGGQPPNVLGIEINQGNASWFAELTLILPGPNAAVLDWGELRREADGKFAVSGIVIGDRPADDPDDPKAMGDDNIVGVPLRIFLDRNSYNLGPILEPGSYVFCVVHGGEVVARQEFEVPPFGDRRPPEVRLDAADIEEAKEEPHPFNIQFNDPSGLDHDSIRDAAVWVVQRRTGERFEARLTDYASTDDLPSSGGFGSYEVDAPGGTWDTRDRGDYRVHIEAERVRDLQGNAIQRSLVGGFRVGIWPDPPTPPRGVEIEIGQNAAGGWNAGVEIRIPEALAATDDWEFDWGEVRHFGHVIVAQGRFRRLGEPADENLARDGLVPPDDGGGAQALNHRYSLGALREGRYLFVFLSNLGHFGKERFRVGGAIDPGAPGGPDGPNSPEVEAFAAWQAAAFMPGDWAVLPAMVDPGANPDGDPWSNFAEFAFGMDPLRADGGAPLVQCEIIEGERGHHLAIRYREMLAAEGVQYRVLGSSDLRRWQDITEQCEELERVAHADGTVDVLACLRPTVGESTIRHLRIEARPVVD